jgi:[lysine-biosynthesis-protein LysW]--L-2-aminoadipate ligase
VTVSAPVAVAASRVRREEKWIFEALERARMPFVQVDAAAMRMRAARAAPRWAVVLNREIAQTRACYLAESMEAAGLRVVNSAAATATCGDKWRSALALAAAALPIPRTVLATSVEGAREAIEEFGFPVVVKPACSSWGRRVAYLRDADAADTLLDYCSALPSPQSRVLCVQEPIKKPGRDIRVVVVGVIVIGAMYRQAARWRTNVALGADVSACPVDADITKLALGAAAATGAEISGVDLLEGQDGDLYVLEVNGRTEFVGLVRATGLDVAWSIVNYIKAVIE